MTLSTKGRYAVMAMADLARHGGGHPVTLADIADRQEISVSYLEQLFAKLRKKGLVKSVRGPGGGYLLAQSPAATRIADIVFAVDEPVRPVRTGVGSKAQGTARAPCLTHDLWEELARRVRHYLDSVTLADVLESRVSVPAMRDHAETRQPSMVAA